MRGLRVAAGTAQFVGKIYYPELKELAEDNCYLRFNLGMSIYDRSKKAGSVEFVSLVAFGDIARMADRLIKEEGHNFCMAFVDVRCRPFVTKNGHKNRIPSFECRHLITKNVPNREQREVVDYYGPSNDSEPF
jgi:hypothetical protein